MKNMNNGMIIDCVREAAIRVCKEGSSNCENHVFPDDVDIHDIRNRTCIYVSARIFENNLREALRNAEETGNPEVMKNAVIDAAKETLLDMRSVFCEIDQTASCDYYREVLLATDKYLGLMSSHRYIFNDETWPKIEDFHGEDVFPAGTVFALPDHIRKLTFKKGDELFAGMIPDPDEYEVTAMPLHKFDDIAIAVIPRVEMFRTYIECMYHSLLSTDPHDLGAGHYNVQTLYDNVLEPERIADALSY